MARLSLWDQALQLPLLCLWLGAEEVFIPALLQQHVAVKSLNWALVSAHINLGQATAHFRLLVAGVEEGSTPLEAQIHDIHFLVVKDFSRAVLVRFHRLYMLISTLMVASEGVALQTS